MTTMDYTSSDRYAFQSAHNGYQPTSVHLSRGLLVMVTRSPKPTEQFAKSGSWLVLAKFGEGIYMQGEVVRQEGDLSIDAAGRFTYALGLQVLAHLLRQFSE